jgi:hypothetical protein
MLKGARRGHQRARRGVSARRRRHHGDRAGRPQQGGKLLRRFGEYRRDYFVTRGNHDRAHSGEQYAACRIGQWQGNCFHDHFFPGDEPTYFTRELRACA